MLRLARLLLVAVVSVPVFAGCASSGGAAGGQSPTAVAGDTGKAAVAALAGQLGIGENYVSMALGAAQGALATGEKTVEAKTAAAQTGVDKAATQAQADGKPLTDPQKSGLLDGIKGLL